MFYLMTHSTHFIYGYMASGILFKLLFQLMYFLFVSVVFICLVLYSKMCLLYCLVLLNSGLKNF